MYWTMFSKFKIQDRCFELGVDHMDLENYRNILWDYCDNKNEFEIY